ncbi:hypothetical protein [Thiohalobacter thiocyanaticus]|uniref:hypothetical protein n=1 Tax=Thiohalobacter thiocyanaticus TaxID=585455 RepID=UPI0012FD2A56|nr:hypothetical protein [Thiohalobacter thiocyanaticus]
MNIRSSQARNYPPAQIFPRGSGTTPRMRTYIIDIQYNTYMAPIFRNLIPRSGSSSIYPDPELNLFAFLKHLQDSIEILSRGIPGCAQHTLQALGRFSRFHRQPLEAQRGIHLVPQQGFTGSQIASQQFVDRLGK